MASIAGTGSGFLAVDMDTSTDSNDNATNSTVLKDEDKDKMGDDEQKEGGDSDEAPVVPENNITHDKDKPEN